MRQTNPYNIVLWSGLTCTAIAGILVFLSIDTNKRRLALKNARFTAAAEFRDRYQSWGEYYHSNLGDELIRRMGWASFMNSSKLRIIRDTFTAAFFIVLLFTYTFKDGSWLMTFLFVGIAHSMLSPIGFKMGKDYLGTGFTTIIAPIFIKIRYYNIGRESSMFLHLLRNEIEEDNERSVLSIIQYYQQYFTLLKDDLILLEHDWRYGKIEALRKFEQRHVNNDDIRYISAILKEIHELGYHSCREMLRENEETMAIKQKSQFEKREKDKNQILSFLNASGVILASVWFVFTMFAWALSFDI